MKTFASKGTFVQSRELLSLQASYDEETNPLSSSNEAVPMMSPTVDKKSQDLLSQQRSSSINKAEQVVEEVEEYYDEEEEGEEGVEYEYYYEEQDNSPLSPPQNQPPNVGIPAVK